MSPFEEGRARGHWSHKRGIGEVQSQLRGIQFLKGIQEHPNPGTGYVATVNYTFSPTLVNQATYNFSYNYFAYFAANTAEIAPALALPFD